MCKEVILRPKSDAINEMCWSLGSQVLCAYLELRE